MSLTTKSNWINFKENSLVTSASLQFIFLMRQKVSKKKGFYTIVGEENLNKVLAIQKHV